MSARTDAVASAIPGIGSERNGRDAKKTPRTRSGSSEQWSPLQTSRLSSKTDSVGHAERGLPRHAIAGAVRDDQVRDEPGIEAAVHLLAPEDARDGAVAVLRVGQRGEPVDELRPQRLVRGAGRDDPARLAAGEVDVDVAEPHRVGPRLRPVDRLPELPAGEEGLEVLPPCASLQHEVAVLDQPRVVVDRAAPRREAVVGQDDEDVLGLERLRRVGRRSRPSPRRTSRPRRRTSPRAPRRTPGAAGRGSARTRAPRGRGTRSSGRAAGRRRRAGRRGSCARSRPSAARPRGTRPREACPTGSTTCRSPSPSS